MFDANAKVRPARSTAMKARTANLLAGVALLLAVAGMATGTVFHQAAWEARAAADICQAPCPPLHGLTMSLAAMYYALGAALAFSIGVAAALAFALFWWLARRARRRVSGQATDPARAGLWSRRFAWTAGFLAGAGLLVLATTWAVSDAVHDPCAESCDAATLERWNSTSDRIDLVALAGAVALGIAVVLAVPAIVHKHDARAMAA
jgi:hypothetical protein